MPLALTDDELDQLYRSAGPIPVHERDRFLQAVAERLGETTPGPGVIFRICSEVQKQFLNGNYPAPPEMRGRRRA
jgi:hypothetical protein